jgi:hypothetical protein
MPPLMKKRDFDAGEEKVITGTREWNKRNNP